MTESTETSASTALSVFKDNKAIAVRTPEDIERGRKALAVVGKREATIGIGTWGVAWLGTAVVGTIAFGPGGILCAIPGFLLAGLAGFTAEGIASLFSRKLRARIAEDKRLKEEAERKARAEHCQRIAVRAKEVLLAALDKMDQAGETVREKINLRFDDPDEPDTKLFLRIISIEECHAIGEPPINRTVGQVFHAPKGSETITDAGNVYDIDLIVHERPLPAPCPLLPPLLPPPAPRTQTP